MSEPEISHRCRSCGASIRQRAFFCPQCGQEVAGTNETFSDQFFEASDDRQSKKMNPDQAGETTPELVAQLEPAALRKITAEPDAAHTQLSGREDGQTDASAIPEAPGSDIPSDGSAAIRGSRVGVQRVTSAARDVLEENVLPRVEKLRRVSSVVIDEASYDPSLRFVLVAAVLFILFLLLLVLSKWIA